MLGDKIKETREAKGLTRTELAATCGLQVKTLGMYERNDRKMDPDTLISISQELDVSTDYLLGLTECSDRISVTGLDPDRLSIANQICEQIYEIAAIDQASGYDRDSLTTCGLILLSLQNLIQDTDADYKAHPEVEISTLKSDKKINYMRDYLQPAHDFEERTLERTEKTFEGITASLMPRLFKSLINR